MFPLTEKTFLVLLNFSRIRICVSAFCSSEGMKQLEMDTSNFTAFHTIIVDSFAFQITRIFANSNDLIKDPNLSLRHI